MRQFFLALMVALLPALVRGRSSPEHSFDGAVESSAANMTSPDPMSRWDIEYESGIIWKIGEGATPLSYTVLPQIITCKTPIAIHLLTFSGGDLVIRSRFSVLLESIIKGPEHYYFGTAASACLEWWNPQRTSSLFFASGGGLGVMRSRGHQIAGAQGQDLNFNWLLYLGARKRVTAGMSATAGLYFQHVSNTGLDKINPGLNALGPMIGLSWQY